MAQELTLFHGSPVRLNVGDYLNPAYCGMWEDCRLYNPQTRKHDINAIYFIANFDIAMQYARREIWAPMDATANTKYFIFTRPDYEMHVYQANVPTNILYDAYGRRTTDFRGEVCSTIPIRITQRHTYNIAQILEHYGRKEDVNAVARIIQKNSENCAGGKFIVPYTFGLQGCQGLIHFNNTRLLRDLDENTIPAPYVAPYICNGR